MKFLFPLHLLAATLLATSCTAPPDSATVDDPLAGAPESQPLGDTTNYTDIVAAQEALSGVVMELEGVIGTAVADCDGQPCIKVFVATDDEELAGRIPDHFGGFPVRTESTGEMRVRPDSGAAALPGEETPPSV